MPGESDNPEMEEPDALISKLKNYDVISFDIFDTLLLRPFSEPSELFYFLGIEFSCPDLRRIRQEAESEARKKRGGDTVRDLGRDGASDRDPGGERNGGGAGTGTKVLSCQSVFSACPGSAEEKRTESGRDQ